MEQLQHFSHDHLLSLVLLKQPNQKNENSDDEDGDDIVVEDHHGGRCNMCEEQIYSFHLCYYRCKDCDYSLHKFCAELPTTLQNHPSHPIHDLTLYKRHQLSHITTWGCHVCHRNWHEFYHYYCSICYFAMDIICATLSQQKIDHPSHPHQLERISNPMISQCHACSYEHKGTFYHCTTCSPFQIHLDCALLPAKLLIQQATCETFTHSHPLTLAYSFSYLDKKAKFHPRCRVCDEQFFVALWLYKCDKCRYYVHVDCATLKREPFMSIFLRKSLGKTVKNFEDDDHPNLLRCPFPDESYNLLKHHFFNQKDFIGKENDGDMFNHSSHQHPLVLFNTEISLHNKSVCLHNPMKKNQLLCDGCVKPITTMPFYKCSEDAPYCGFALHEWCARLPSKVEDHPGHPQHKLVLMPNIPGKFFGVFHCAACWLPSNGFAYGCTTCEYYVDINCAFTPIEITHEAHPHHLLTKINSSANLSETYCIACNCSMECGFGFNCHSCDFYLDIECAFLLPKIVRHKYDKHPLSLRYYPVENHISEYFCEICEDELNPLLWFYHCTMCAQSIHAACAPLILQCEQAAYSRYKRSVFQFLNVKFGGTLEIKEHAHPLAFVQGIECDGECMCRV